MSAANAGVGSSDARAGARTYAYFDSMRRWIVGLVVVLALGYAVAATITLVFFPQESTEPAPTPVTVIRTITLDDVETTLTRDGISFRYPADWHSVDFSRSNSPHRLAIASYPLQAEDVEGDCGGAAAVGRLPADGAVVLVIDYGEGQLFRVQPSAVDSLKDGQFAEYECFGPSTMFGLRLGERRDVQVHIAVGTNASELTTYRALAVLRSLRLQHGS